MPRPYRDRQDAGAQLAQRLAAYAGWPAVIVLGLPRGGVPVAAAVAAALGTPLDVWPVRKLGLPEQPELAMGAIASGGGRVMNEDVLTPLQIPVTMIATVETRERDELVRREQLYRGGRPPPVITGRQVILVDDGLATGATMRAAVQAVQDQGPARIIVAVPVGAAVTCAALGALADEVVCAAVPDRFAAVGLWYEDFRPTSDAEVVALLR